MKGKNSRMPIGGWVFLTLTGLLTTTAWMRGGTPTWSQRHLLWVALALSALVIPAAVKRYGGVKKAVLKLISDPVVVAGAAFLFLLALQWWNAGRHLFFNPITEMWDHTNPRIPWLPSAVSQDEAAEMLRWFAPALAILLALRHALSRLAKRTVLHILVINGAALALFGVIQYTRGAESIYSQPLKGHFFAAFGYPNHAGAYFLLIASLALGLIFRNVMKQASPPSASGFSVWIICFALTFFGAILSLSRAVMLFSVVLLAIAAFTLFITLWPRFQAAKRLNLLVVTVAFGCLCFFVYDAFADQAIKKQWGKAPLEKQKTQTGVTPGTPGRSLWSDLAADRKVTYKTAIEIWLDSPWFGRGGWGFRHFVMLKRPPESWGRVEPGQANVHNDPLQFLVEFGIIGGGLLMIGVGALAGAVIKRKVWRQPAAVPVMAGVVLVFTHSLVDLPFRCPAILFTWLTLLAAVDSLVTQREKTVSAVRHSLALQAPAPGDGSGGQRRKLYI
ncbi:MAG: O-antigen ligase family protein [Lentisphaeria bacterium]|nr:O-antigen ligase family protein [Lentisphaeria bacterium]